MAYLDPLSFDQFQQNIVEAYNAVATRPANTGANSSLGPVFNGAALLATALQGQVIYVNAVARLATSTGADVDSFVNPFGLTREPEVDSTGTVTFSTSSPASSQILIYPGTVVQTIDGIQFSVIADTTQSGWSVSLGAYVIGTGTSSVNATVQALVGGVGGNVLAQTITQIVGSATYPAPAGVSGVVNSAAFTNGANQESDAALKARFALFMQGRWANDAAIETAVDGVQSGLTFSLGDGLDQNGNATPNYFTVLVNELNQSTGPTSSLIASVNSAVLASRAVGVPYQVIGPQLLTVNASVTLQLAPGSSTSAITAAAQAAFTSYLNNIGLGNTAVFPSTVSSATTRCSYNAIVALLTSISGVVSLPDPPGLLLNGATVDIVAPWGTQLVAGSLVVTTQ